jgi:hypothetical protein
VKSYVKTYLQALHQWIEEQTSFVDTSVRRIMFKGVVNVDGDNVVVTRVDGSQGTPWKAKIKEFIYLRTNDKVNIYFVVDYYKHMQK